MSDSLVTSVVIVNYNSGEYLRRCLNSLFGSDTSLEVVVVDNASSDASAECVEGMNASSNELRLLRNDANAGFAAAVNKGVAQTHGDVVVLLNPDSAVNANSIRLLVQALEDNTNAGIAGGLVFNQDGTEQNGCRRREPNFMRGAIKSVSLLRFLLGKNREAALDMTTEPLPSLPIPVDAVSGSFMAIRRRVFDEINGMDTGYFLHCEDLDICRAVRDKGYQVLFVPAASIFHRQGVSGGDHPYRVEWYKRNSMLRYFHKHQASKLNSFQRILISTLVTAHFGRVCLSLFAKRRGLKSTAREVFIEPADSLAAESKTLLVTGASSMVGGVLIDQLLDEGFSVIAVSRSKEVQRNNTRFRWFNHEYMHKVNEENFPIVHAVIHLAPIWSLPDFLPSFSRLGVKRIVALSSTSVLAKKISTDLRERDMADLLAQGEQKTIAYSCHHGIALIVIRASMIYDGMKDQNISRLLRFINRYGFFPLAGNGAGLRQPVHVEDVAAACVQSLDGQFAFGKTYTISGGQVLSYKDMINELFYSLSKTPRFLSIPVRGMRRAMSFVFRIVNKSNLSPAMIDRMTADLCYSHAEAAQDFAYQARPFSV